MGGWWGGSDAVEFDNCIVIKWIKKLVADVVSASDHRFFVSLCGKTHNNVV